MLIKIWAMVMGLVFCTMLNDRHTQDYAGFGAILGIIGVICILLSKP